MLVELLDLLKVWKERSEKRHSQKSPVEAAHRVLLASSRLTLSKNFI